MAADPTFRLRLPRRFGSGLWRACALVALTTSVASAADFPVSWTLPVTPSTVAITAGDTVTWNGPLLFHTITETDAAFSVAGTTYITPDSTYTRPFSTAGTFYFKCTIHPSMQLTVTVAAACAAPSGPLAALDIDGNGQVDAATDGLLVVRYLLGLRGYALISGALGASASRCTSTAIEAYLAVRVVP